jgi:chloride channel 3/4/5
MFVLLTHHFYHIRRKTASEIPPLVFLLLATLVIKLVLSIVTFGIRVPGGVFLPALAIGAIFGRAIGLVMQYLTLEHHDHWFFSACPADFETHGRCVIPGVYAMVGAAASLAGVTRTTVSLVVIMFELTHSLTYAVPIMAAVMISKWTSDAFFPSGIYDLVIDLQEYPYLESKREYIHKSGVSELTEYLETIDIEKLSTVNQLRKATERLEALGYAEDGGFPIVTEERTLVGYIACSELLHAIDVVTKRVPEGEDGNVKCHFKRVTMDEYSTTTPLTLSASGSAIFTENGTELQRLGDFSQYVDQVRYFYLDSLSEPTTRANDMRYAGATHCKPTCLG